MIKMPSRAEVEQIRKRYPAGTRIELMEMDDPYTMLSAGSMGTVTGVDDAGQIMMAWDMGGSLSLIPGVDMFTIISRRDAK